ncbi:hypothetical protein [Pedobacter sp. GR22-10]|uniref:hypothetical protein n=1 Tax=Pedobacter sp. GR22-10 TaxID=2994472 RepID=UPI0022464CD6|nr:hypothetical protein [Pedobacter sp. GR22-10]MCX2429873.1 hypothetical protein [Pedobacter sp. GR22-10]
MYITDLTGQQIEVTDLEAALDMVEKFLSYTKVEEIKSLQEFEQQRQRYWQDMKQKLLTLKEY